MAHKQNTAVAIFESTKDSFLWTSISQAANINWSIDFLNDNYARLDWALLSANPSLPWSMELIELFEGYWDWNAISGIISNRNYIQTDEFSILANRHCQELDWVALSEGDNLSSEVVEQYIDSIDWSVLSSNMLFPWSREFLGKYKNRIDWNLFSENFIMKHFDRFFNIRTIELFQHHFNWEYLSENRNLKWSIHLMARFQDKWDWSRLINNHGLEWNKRMLIIFNEYIPTGDIKLLQESYLWEKLLSDEMKPYKRLSTIEEILASLRY